jgi:hypothetical protein
MLAFLHQTGYKNSFINTRVDMDDLWNFFFSSGFIYPEKYVYLMKHSEEIKETYRKLYRENSGIGRYFVHMKNGTILGHMAMVRAYENTWLLHHHAASNIERGNAGIQVLNQAGNFTNSCHRIHSMHMDYLTCFFRPENRFPARVFGKVAEDTKDPKSCSLDSFAYFHIRDRSASEPPSGGWTFDTASPMDLQDLNSYYEKKSGGLMMEAFTIASPPPDYSSLIGEYKNSGLHREISFFSLKKSGELKAVFMADISPPGLNLSELTNCIKIFVTDDREVTNEIIYNSCYHISSVYPNSPIPVMLYPLEAAEKLHIGIEKCYNMWVLSMEATDEYFKQLEKLFRSQTKH